MTEEIVNHVRSYSSGRPNRAFNQAGTHVFPIDGPAHHGGAPEEITPADAFLAGISACGVLLVEGRARETALPLYGVEAAIDGRRNAADPSWFTRINVSFLLTGPSQNQAETLVQYYKDG